MSKHDTTEAFKLAHRPMTIVLSPGGSVGIIREVSINDCQKELRHQLSYAVEWLHRTRNDGAHNAWWEHSELKLATGGNLFDIIAKTMCHPFGSNRHHVSKLLGEK